MGNTRYSIDKANLSTFRHAKLLYISTSKYEDDWQSIPHSHAFSELFFVTDGKGFFIAESEEFPVRSNDLILINPHVQHTEKSMDASPLEYIVLGIEGLSFSAEDMPSSSNILSAETISGTVYKFNISNSNFYTYLNIMLEEVSKKDGLYEEVSQNLLEILLIYILRHGSIAITENTSTVLTRECLQIKNYLDSHYAEDITLDTLADLTHMNKYYIAHAFAEHIGLSPINYLLQKRIQEGKYLLEATTHSIADIASMLGFSSQSYFSQAFKKAVGQAPAQYRKQQEQKGQ